MKKRKESPNLKRNQRSQKSMRLKKMTKRRKRKKKVAQMVKTLIQIQIKVMNQIPMMKNMR